MRILPGIAIVQNSYENSYELDAVREQLDKVESTATKWKGKPENRSTRIRESISRAIKSLHEALAIEHIRSIGE